MYVHSGIFHVHGIPVTHLHFRYSVIAILPILSATVVTRYTGGKGQCTHLEHCEYIVNTWTVFQPYTQWVCGDYILSDSYQCTCSLPAQLFLRTFSVFLGCTMCIPPLVHLEFLHSVPTWDTAIISLWYIHSSLFQFSNPILQVCKSGLHSKFPLPVFIACSLCVLY